MIKWLLIYLMAAAMGASWTWTTVGPSENFTPLVGGAYALLGSLLTHWLLLLTEQD